MVIDIRSLLLLLRKHESYIFGNHDVGVAALDALSQSTDVVGVVAHPSDPEDGVKYKSLYDFFKRNWFGSFKGAGKDPRVSEFARKLSPDLIWVTDYRYLIATELFATCKFGAVNLHQVFYRITVEERPLIGPF